MQVVPKIYTEFLEKQGKNATSVDIDLFSHQHPANCVCDFIQKKKLNKGIAKGGASPHLKI